MRSSTSSASLPVKTNRSFSPVRRYAWIFTILVGLGGQFVPSLGLLVPFIMATLVSTSLFKGKYWCGNICPHGSFFDNLLQPISRQAKIPEFLRSRPVVGAVLVFFIYNMASRFWSIYGTMGFDPLYQRLGFLFANTYLMVLLVGGLLAVVVNPRTWCVFCPMGTMQEMFYKLGRLLGINDKTDQRVSLVYPEKCRSCGKCGRVCPVQLEPHRNFSTNNQFQDERCIRCSTCTRNCPAGILHMAVADEIADKKAGCA